MYVCMYLFQAMIFFFKKIKYGQSNNKERVSYYSFTKFFHSLTV